MTKVKSNSTKPNKDNQFELIDLDLVKSEPEETVPVSTATTSVAKLQSDNANPEFVGNPIVIAPQVSPRAIGKAVPVALSVAAGAPLQQANYSLTGTSGQPSKTFLLINNRTGVQSMLIGGSRKPFSGVIEPSQLPQIRVRTSMGVQNIVSSAGPKTSSLVVAQKQADCGTVNLSSKIVADGTLGTLAVKPCSNSWEYQPRPLSTVRDIIFTSRSIDADGTVKTTKEYLCNFCQYKVSVQSEFEAHKGTHMFSCNHCKYKALSRFDVLKHKKEKHPSCSEELAGYHDLDKLIDSVTITNSTQILTPACFPSTSGAPTQFAELVRPPSSEPPQLELQAISAPPVAAVDKFLTSGNCAVSKTPSEHFDDSFSRRSNSGDSSTQNSGKATESGSTDALTADNKESSRTRSSRPRRAVTEKKQTLRDIDTDSQAEMDNKTDDDDWEEKMPKSSGKKKSRKDSKSTEAVRLSSGGKTAEATKIVYHPVQDQTNSPKKLSGMKYKCTVCSFETSDGLVLTDHVKSHEVAAKSEQTKAFVTNSGLNQSLARDSNQPIPISKEVMSTVHWSCFYCNLSSASQATIVGHVMKAHPGNPIQLKRMSVPHSSSGAVQQLQTNSVGSSSGPSTVNNNVSTSTPNQETSSSQGIGQNSSVQMNQTNKPAEAVKSLKASNPENEGCLWGCYYCSVQSVDRSEVIGHLKREHSDSKLIVTRRRITHIPATFKSSNKDEEDPKPSGENANSDAGAGKSSSGKDEDGTIAMSEKEDESRGRQTKRKVSGAGANKKKKSLVNVSSEPRVLRSRRVSPGSTSPSHRDGSPSHASVNSSEGMGPPSKKRKTKLDNQDKNATTSRVSVPVVGTDNLDNDKHVNDEQQLDKQKTTPIVVRKIQDYPKSAAIKSLVEDIKWKCSYCEFRAVHRSKVIYHVTSNHSERPVRFYRISRGRAADSTDICSRLRGPRSVREANFLRNGNWLWQCPVCNRKHVSKGYLNVHLKVAHPKQSSRGVDLVPVRKCRSLDPEDTQVEDCSISLVRAEDMVHYDSLSNILLDNGLSLIKSLDVDDELECDVVRHRKYKCGKCHMRGFRPMIVKLHFLEIHSATEVLVIDLKNSLKNKNGDGCQMYSCLKGDCKFFTGHKSELESHYNDYPEHARVGPCQPPLSRRELNDSTHGSDDNDSEITDPCFERPESRSRTLESVDCNDSAAKDDGPGDYIAKADRQVSARIPGEVAQPPASTSSCFSTSESGPKNSVRATMLLSPKNSDIVSGLSLLKKTLSTSQVMSDMKKLNKSNSSDDQQQAQALPTDNISMTLQSSRSYSALEPLSEFDISAKSSAPSLTQPQNPSVQSSRHHSPRAHQRRSCPGQEHFEGDGDGGQFKYTVDGKLLKKPRRCSSPKYVDRYQCVICGHRMGQLGQMKQHLMSHHTSLWKEKAFCIDVRARELRKRQKILFCLRENCAFYCKNDLELSAHEASLGDCPVLLSKSGITSFGNETESQLTGEFASFSCFEPTLQRIETAVESNANGKFHKDESSLWSKSTSKCNKSYQCSYCTFTTLDLTSIKSHVTSQHKADTLSCSSSLASTRRAGFSEIATKMTSDGTFVTSVNDGQMEEGSEDDGDNDDNDVDDDNENHNSKDNGVRNALTFKSDLRTAAENGEENAIAPDLPGVDGGKIYTVL